MAQVLVLDASFIPLNITSLQRGVALVYLGKAEVVKEDEKPIKTSSGEFVRPVIIRLLRSIEYHVNKAKGPNRKKILQRDGHRCGYCLKKDKFMTIDHIIPRSKGGKNTWTNLVTACSKCNSKKGDRTPKQAGMEILIPVTVPTLIDSHMSIKQAWNELLDSWAEM